MLQFSCFWQSVLSGPCLTTITLNVFGSYLKNWQPSQIAPIIHILDFWNSCAWEANMVVISFHCQWKWFCSTELSGRFHTPGADPRLYLAALCYTAVTTSRLRRCFDRVQNEAGRWDKAAALVQLYWICLVSFLLANEKASVNVLTSQSAVTPRVQAMYVFPTRCNPTHTLDLKRY